MRSGLSASRLGGDPRACPSPASDVCTSSAGSRQAPHGATGHAPVLPAVCPCRLSSVGRLSPPLFQAVCDRRMSVCHWTGCCRRLYRSAPGSTVASPAPHRSPLDRVTSHHSQVTKSPITSHQCWRPAHSRTASVRLLRPTLGRPEASCS